MRVIAVIPLLLLGHTCAQAQLPYRSEYRGVIHCPPPTRPATTMRPPEASTPRPTIIPMASPAPRKPEPNIESKPAALAPAVNHYLMTALITLLAAIGLFTLIGSASYVGRAIDRLFTRHSTFAASEWMTEAAAPVEMANSAEEFRLQAAALRALQRDLDEQLRAARGALDEHRRWAEQPKP